MTEQADVADRRHRRRFRHAQLREGEGKPDPLHLPHRLRELVEQRARHGEDLLAPSGEPCEPVGEDTPVEPAHGHLLADLRQEWPHALLDRPLPGRLPVVRREP